MTFPLYAYAVMGRWALFTCRPVVYILLSCAAQFSTSHVRYHALKLTMKGKDEEQYDISYWNLPSVGALVLETGKTRAAHAGHA